MRATLPFLGLAALATGCRPAEPTPVRVVIAVIDGVRLDESFAPWESSLTGEPARELLPRIWSELAPQGTVVLPTYNMGTTITAQGHATMFTGARQRMANFSVDNGPGLYRPARPTLGEELRRQTETTQTESLILANADLIWPLEWSMMPGYGRDLASEWFFVSVAPGSDQPAPDDVQAVVALGLEMDDLQPRLTLANFKEVDRKGHYGDNLDQYVDAVEEIDDPIVELWEKLQADTLYGDRTVLVVVSDHGRHRIEDDAGFGEDYWRSHGNSSAGDREVPLLLLGPGVRQGQIVEAPYSLEDLAPTLAALLDIEMPWARGMPITEALNTPPGWTRAGVGAAAVDGDYLVEERFEADPYRRSGIWWEGQRLSAEDAWAAEGPSVVQTDDGALACWREIALDSSWMPWVPHCALLSGDGDVSLIDGPEPEVGAFWDPELRVVDGAVHIAYIHNPEDIAELGVDEDVAPREARWSGSSWELGLVEHPSIYYPTDLSVADRGEGKVLWAFGGNVNGSEARYKRRLYLQDNTWTDEGMTAGATRRLDLDVYGPQGEWRLEYPVVRAEGDHIELAAVSFSEQTTELWRITSDDGGQSWLPPEVVVSSAGLLPNLKPVWVGDRLAWAELEGVFTKICVEGADCVTLDSARVADLDWDGAYLHAVRGNPDGSWTRVPIAF
jgi:hypothetical protein